MLNVCMHSALSVQCLTMKALSGLQQTGKPGIFRTCAFCRYPCRHKIRSLSVPATAVIFEPVTDACGGITDSDALKVLRRTLA